MANVFLCSPTHNGLIDNRMAKAFLGEASEEHHILNVVQQSSLLANARNNLMVYGALNVMKTYNLTWFAMLHSDIVPEPFWLDKLIKIAEENGADLLSVVVPHKIR